MRDLGLERAIVTRVSGPAHAFVRLVTGGRHEYGPCPVVEGLWTDDAVTGAATAGTAHVHPAGIELAPGDTVVVGFLGGDPNAPVILGRLP